ncbi:MAG: hypothetical protein EBR32_00605 [Bacteroidetes bacterium]|nr:hypothetical protein [Bacteroidota bacterium]
MNLNMRIQRLYNYPVRLKGLLKEQSEDSTQKKDQRKEKKEKKKRGHEFAPFENSFVSGETLSCDEQIKYSQAKAKVYPLPLKNTPNNLFGQTKANPTTGKSLDYTI